jgi:hypothetical protein
MSVKILALFLVAAPFDLEAQNLFTNGLVAYYPFSGKASDASGNGRANAF